MKHLEVTFTDGSVWFIPARFIAEIRAEYYAKSDCDQDDGSNYDEIFKEEVETAMEDDYLIIDWAHNNMNWEDVKMDRLEVEEPKHADYDKEWATGKAEMVVGG